MATGIRAGCFQYKSTDSRHSCQAIESTAGTDLAITLLLSGHRTGALESALFEIGDRVLADLDLMAAGLPPQNCVSTGDVSS